MRVVIVGRDREALAPLIYQLTESGFEVIMAENNASAISLAKKGSIHFLLAEPALLVDHGLGREVQKHCPLVRLLGLAAQPSLLSLVDALASGLTDYFPRSPECYDQVFKALMLERRRIVRWQKLLLAKAPMVAAQVSGGIGESECLEVGEQVAPTGGLFGETLC